MNIRIVFLTVWMVGMWGLTAHAEPPSVSVVSSTEGIQLSAELQKRIRVVLGETATGAVWVLEVPRPANGSDPCPTALTNITRSGIRFSRGADKDVIGREYLAFGGWYGTGGTLCAILESGSTPQTLYVSFY